MNAQSWLFVSVLCWSAAASAEIYRCEQDGRLRFTDQPCVAGQAPLEIAEPNRLETSTGEKALAADYDRELHSRRRARDAADEEARKLLRARHELEAKVHLGKVRNEVVVGMTRRDVQSILGEPAGSSHRATGEADSETWTFRDGNIAHTVQFKDGKVASVSRRTTKRRR